MPENNKASSPSISAEIVVATPADMKDVQHSKVLGDSHAGNLAEKALKVFRAEKKAEIEFKIESKKKEALVHDVEA